MADFGCGSGHYTIEAGRRAGKSGKIYAIDIQKEMLSYTRAQAKLAGLENIETIWTDLELKESTRLKAEAVDIITISNILFQADNKGQVIEEARRILKPGGRVAVIEWDVGNQPASPAGRPANFGPVMEKRISLETVKNLFGAAGFVFERSFNPGDHHYGLIFKK